MTDGRAGGPEGGLPGPRRGRAVDADLRGQAVAAVVRHGMASGPRPGISGWARSPSSAG